MREFDYRQIKNLKWDSDILGYIAQIYQAKGMQELFLKQKPAELERLVEIAKIQSTQASNEIEGIRTTNTRLKQLMEEKTDPKNRDEEEIAGYRDVLDIIHNNFEEIPLTPNYILQLHKILYSHDIKKSFGGKFKSVQNYISALGKDGECYTLFTPLAPYETPMAIENICKEYNKMIDYMEVDPLILIPIFIHDFLCIHPFLDGNGRMSRLLTTLLLYRSGFLVGKYISLEAKIAKNKDGYYNALSASQKDWHIGNDDPTHFIKYLLSIILSAYRDFEERLEIVSPRLSAYDRVSFATEKFIAKFTKANIISMCPTLSASAVEKSLNQLVEKSIITRHGQGRSTFYTRNIK